ncbi:flavodoxin family protein [Candidatus Bipolaricaulota bacterium]
MKILAIVGSLRKGNSYRITQQVEDQLKSYAKHDAAGEVDLDFTYLFLTDASLELCKGCFACISRGEDHCPLKDSRADIERQILSSDGVILVSPVYSANVPWLMKNFIDRFSYTLHRPVFVGQKLMLLVTGGETGLKGTLKSLSQTMGGSDLVSKLAVKTPPYRPRPKHQESTARDIDRASRKFYRSLKSGRSLPPTFLNVIWFQAFKAISEKAKDYFPADYEFYEDKSHFFYETKVNPLKTSAAKLMLRLLLRGMDKSFYMKKSTSSE